MAMHDVDGLNTGYARLLLDEYLENPEAVPPEWRVLFESGESDLVLALPGLARLLDRAARRTEHSAGNGPGNGIPAGGVALEIPADGSRAAAPIARAEALGASMPAEDLELLGAVAAAMALVKAHRMHGHLATRLDPLGSDPPGDPALDPLHLEPKLTPEIQARIPTRILRVHVEGETLREALPRLQETYCGTMAYEIEHIADHEQRVWLRQAIESWRYRTAPTADEKRALYARLCEVEGSERYLRRAFLG